MTIKRRLFLSNILMLVLPIVLSMFAVYIIMMILIWSPRTNQDGERAEEHYQWIVQQLLRSQRDWKNNDSTLEEVGEDFTQLLERFSQTYTGVIYEDKKLVYSSAEESSDTSYETIVEFILSQDTGNVFVADQKAAYRLFYKNYDIILLVNDFKYLDEMLNVEYINTFMNAMIVMTIAIIVIVLLTNRFLTSFVFKRIVKPIEILIYGFHQLRDGNLNYRVDYSGKDEFAEVFNDFNDMAQKLLEFVNARQKDEDNRKELIAGISHDLRTPLTSIKAYIEGLEKGVAASPQSQKKYLDIIKTKANDLEQIVNQLFLYSKLDIGEYPFYMERVDIGAEIKKLYTLSVKEYEQKGLSLIVEQNVQNVFVTVDAVQLRNVFINIMENSVKYKNKEQAAMVISSKETEDDVLITMKDNGPGVSEDAVSKLFDVFYRSDASRNNPGKGSGLGLAITERIIMKLGGSVWAENVLGGGLAINIRLPKSKEVSTVEENTNNRR